jgi:hypothetical protein
MKAIARTSTLVVLLARTALFGAVHHTPAQAAYFDAHAKCVKQLRDAKNDAASKDAAERKRLVEAAKQEYRRCEAHAHLIWKYYPAQPPQDAAPGMTTTAGSGGSATPNGTPPHP